MIFDNLQFHPTLSRSIYTSFMIGVFKPRETVECPFCSLNYGFSLQLYWTCWSVSRMCTQGVASTTK